MDEAVADRLTADERSLLLVVARAAVSASALGIKPPPPPRAPSPALLRRTGAFVTLRKAGALRGCIGRTDATEQMIDVVSAMALAAATQDPRFSRVRPEEVNDLSIEISVLGPLASCDPKDVVLGRDGLVVEGFGRRGLLLPEVATAQGWSRTAFIRGTCRKAGLPADAVDNGASLLSFCTEHFEEQR
jgi:AmmeMemoRadiSam system protein A